MPTPSVKMGLSLPSQTDRFSTADIRSNWEKIDAAPGSHICTSATRPSWGTQQQGRKIYETDTNLEWVWTGTSFRQVTSQPPGSIVMFGGAAAPDGWLLCDGAARSRTTYSGLFSVIGTTFGAGDNSTTFNVPDMRDRMPFGASSTRARGTKGGSATTFLAASNLPPHSHTIAHTHSIDHKHPATNTGGESAHHTHEGTTNPAGDHYHDNWAGKDTNGSGQVGENRVLRDVVYGGMLNVRTSTNGSHHHSFSTGIQSAFHHHALDLPNFTGSSGPSSSPSSGDGPGSGSPFNVLNPYVALNFIIKT